MVIFGFYSILYNKSDSLPLFPNTNWDQRVQMPACYHSSPLNGNMQKPSNVGVFFLDFKRSPDI